MLFQKDEELELQPKRTRTLLISAGIHVVLLVILVLNPELLTSPPKRIIKVLTQDYDLSKDQITELVTPPNAARPAPAVPDKPLVQPPVPKQETQPPPPQVQQPPPPQQQAPPPPPPPPPQTPPPVIGPDDVLKEGARPDAQPKASRGDTREQARAGGQEQPPPKPEQSKQVQQQAKNDVRLPPNMNPNAMRLPGGNIMDSAKRSAEQELEEERRHSSSSQIGGRTGLPNGLEEPNFATEEPTILSDTKGYDFGPYMNQVINRVRQNWFSLMPEIARLGKRGKVVIIFTITKNGIIANLRQAATSGSDPLDHAAMGGITLSNPFAQLPAGFDGDHLDLQFTFLYNIR